MKKKRNNEKWILVIFLLVPFMSSIISTFHLVDFVLLGNTMAMAVVLAITFELGSIVSFVTLSEKILKKIKKEYIWFIFILLFILQAFGNVYASFDYIREKLIVDPTWLDSFIEMTLGVLDPIMAKLMLSVIIGLPIPLISLILLKSAIDYFYTPDELEDVSKSGTEFTDEKVEINNIEDIVEKKEEVKPIEKKEVVKQIEVELVEKKEEIKQIEVEPVEKKKEVKPVEQIKKVRSNIEPKKNMLNVDLLKRFNFFKK